ncbi:MAG: hypothetical protein IPP32_16405 [Bacteroidetes bacterium]|nr:hypothetical protein [Bacteroidota bacterium]
MDKVDYDKIYEETYLKFINENIARFIKVLKPDVDEKREVRFRKERDRMLEEFNSYRNLRIGETNYNDYYFERLQTYYRECFNDYESPLKNFIQLKLQDAKIEAARLTENLNMELLSLNEVDTVKYLAKYYALDKTLTKTFPFEIGNNESIESIENRLRGNKVSEISNNEEIAEEVTSSDDDQAKKYRKEFTTSRQIIAIHYLFEFANIKNCDQTEKARFARFLIGKELGNTKIENTTIYKKVRSPFKTTDSELKKDLRFVKEFFEKLNRPEIVTAINKEIDK